MTKAKSIYVAATRQNEGKTTLSLGLIGELVRRGMKVGFIKPVGQQYVEAEGVKVDKDSLLMVRVFDVEAKLQDTSPIAVDRYFTRNYIDNPEPDRLRKLITESYERIAADKDIVIIEGTGHAGVGGVIDLSNAQVAKMLDAPVVMVSGGGIGKPIDEIILNQAVFEKEGAQLVGVVINKILEDRLESIRGYLRRSTEYHGLKLLGVMPALRQLSRLTIRQVARDVDCEIMVGEEFLDNTVEDMIVGAMTAHRGLDYMKPGVLMITGGDREDLMLAAMGMHLADRESGKGLAGILLTGGMAPHSSVHKLLQHAGFPVLLHEDDSYGVATRVHNLVAKIQVQDKVKHQVAIKMVQEHVDIDGLLDAI